MYNFLKGGEQYKYATRPIIVTLPDTDPHFIEHCTDHNYISETKIKFSKKMFELFGIHLDWHTYRTRVKGQECLFRGEVMYWRAGEDVGNVPCHTLCLFRPFTSYLRKKAKIELVSDHVMNDCLLLNGDL